MDIIKKIKKRWAESIRILKITRKPTPMQFRKIVKITGTAMFITGLLGFLIYILFRLPETAATKLLLILLSL